jgi:hypothetical protein
MILDSSVLHSIVGAAECLSKWQAAPRMEPIIALIPSVLDHLRTCWKHHIHQSDSSLGLQLRRSQSSAEVSSARNMDEWLLKLVFEAIRRAGVGRPRSIWVPRADIMC